MRTTTTWAALIVSGLLRAQCAPAPAFTTLYAGTEAVSAPPGSSLAALGCNLLFDLQVDDAIAISTIAVNLNNDANNPFTGNLVGQTGRLAVWTFPTTWVGNHTVGTGGATTFPPSPPGWTLRGVADLVVAPPNAPSSATGFTGGTSAGGNIVLPAGTYGVALEHLPIKPGQPSAGASLSSLYTNTLTHPAPLTFADQYLTLSTSNGQGSAFSGGVGSRPVTANITLTYAATGASAFSCRYGAGCYDRKATFYQSFAPVAVAGGGTPSLVSAAGGNVRHLRLIFDAIAGRYDVQAGTGSYPLVAPNSTAWFVNPPTHVNSIAPAVASFGSWDDANSVLYALPFTLPHPEGSATAISIGSNGVIYLGATTGSRQFYFEYEPWLQGPASFAAAFADWVPGSGAGEIYADSDGSSWVAVSWVGIREYPANANASTNNSFQVVLRSSGEVEFAWGALKVGISPVLIGYTPGSSAPDPGVGAGVRAAPDFQAALPFASGDGTRPVSLAALARPRIGTVLQLQSSNLDATVGAVFTLVSLGMLPPPGFDIGLSPPGCNAFIMLPEIAASLDFGTVAVTANFGVIPGGIAGLDVFAQSVGLSGAANPFNQLNVLASQGLRLHIEN